MFKIIFKTAGADGQTSNTSSASIQSNASSNTNHTTNSRPSSTDGASSGGRANPKRGEIFEKTVAHTEEDQVKEIKKMGKKNNDIAKNKKGKNEKNGSDEEET